MMNDELRMLKGLSDYSTISRASPGRSRKGISGDELKNYSMSNKFTRSVELCKFFFEGNLGEGIGRMF